MADLEAVLADVSYLMAMEKSKCTPAARYVTKLLIFYIPFNGKVRFRQKNLLNVCVKIVFQSFAAFPDLRC
jgi:hypothetical protein